MRRALTAILLTVGMAVAAVFAVGASNDGGGSSNYNVRAIFDDVASAVPGEDVKIAGAKVGKVGSMDVTPEKKAAITLNITNSGFTPFHRDAHCTIRPQSLIGEKYVECTPGTPSHPALKQIQDGAAGEGDYLLPLANTSAPVDLDLVNNVMRLPYRQRLAIIINELGTGLAGRGQDLNDVIRRADPALLQTDRVLRQLANENVTLANLATQSDRALAPLARDRTQLSGFIRNANSVGEATAARSGSIQRGIQKLPEFLRQLKPTMTDLGALADEMTPTLVDLNTAAPSLSRLMLELGPFSRSATVSLKSLGKTTEVGGPVLVKALPVVKQLNTFAKSANPVSKNLDSLTASLDRTGGLEQAMNYIFFQMTAINGFDEISHYLRAALLVNTCSTYSVTEVAGCSAHFTQTKSVQSSSATSVKTATDALANHGNAPKGSDTATTALAKVAKGLLGLGKPTSPTQAQLQAMNKQGVARIRAGAQQDSSPALKGVDNGRNQALLNYLLGKN